MYWLVVLLAIAAGYAEAQLTAQSSIAPDLRECYTVPGLLDRNNLPPMTMPVLIDIIQKIEDDPNVNLDLRQLAVQLLHTFRQDGIEFHQPGTNLPPTANILPFAPTFHSFHRHRLLLARIIPGNLQVLPNNTVNSQLKCTLHHMLSTTVDARVRGNENQCNQLSQYRALRTARHIPGRFIKDDDVELLDLSQLKTIGRNGQMRHFNPNDDVEYMNNHGSQSERQVLGESTCPLAGGVVNTQWGAVSGGNLIAGIAAGTEMQRIPIFELTKGSGINYQNVQATVTSIYPATLAGDLAEAVLIQGTESGATTVSVGTAGNWNSSQAFRYFMLHRRENLEMTDPEIRGGLDGFVLGSTVSSVLGATGSLRLSQLLDMYYSPRNGVFDPTLRACNRRELQQQYVVNTQLIGETLAFAAALDTNMPLRGTITGGLNELVTNAVNAFQSYASSNINDLNCIITEATSQDFRLKTNLYIALDSSWDYNVVYPAISFLLDSIEVGKFGSSVTLLNAFDGSVVINTTFSLADFHSLYTLERHRSMFTGVNLQNALTNIRIMMHDQLNQERTLNYVGGNSTVLLFLLNTSVQNSQTVLEQARIINETVPDLRILFATSTNQLDNLWNLVRDMHNDIRVISLNSEGTGVEIAMSFILGRIVTANRRIVNSNCGSTFPSEANSGTRQFDDFVSPGDTTFYAISPNYFFGNNDNRRVRISRAGSGVGNLIVCHSRVITQPRQNGTIVGIDENAMTCETITGGGFVEINMQNACEGHCGFINSCPPLYISVQSTVVGTPTLTATCPACRFPYDIRYQVQIQDFGCFSGSSSIAASIFLLLVAVFFQLF